MNTNYQLILDKTLREIADNGTVPSLLLHSCCAPCSSYVLEYLNRYFNITLFFYNPNIENKSEYDKRADELKRLVSTMPHQNPIEIIDGDYEPQAFTQAIRGLEGEPEGGGRCSKCYRLRLLKTAETAKSNGFDYFTTTLSISPHKNAKLLNEIGNELSEQFGIKYLFSDFKKRNGYKRSCELSQKYGLYRQDYCGCIYSQAEAERRKT